MGVMKTFEELVNEERERQEEKWGEQNHHPLVWLAILGEEFGEVSTAVLADVFSKEKQGNKDMETELTHVAAVAKAMWESGKRNGWL